MFILVLGCTSTIAIADTRLTYTAASLPEVSISTPSRGALIEVESDDIASDTAVAENESPVAISLGDESIVADVPNQDTTARAVPFYSQFADISDPAWKGIGCGIASLAMLIDYYEPAVPVDTLLAEGIAADAYLSNAGWTYAGLIGVAKARGLAGKSIVMHDATTEEAYAVFEKEVEEGPVMASVYYTFTPGHPIPHLVVVNDISNGTVYYNDPAEASGGGTISEERFKAAWKKRFIVIRPTNS